MLVEKMIQAVDGFESELVFYGLENSQEIDVDRTRPVVLICPGGGYEFVSDREAEPIAINFLNAGFHAAVLRYTVNPMHYLQPLKEVATAVKTLRSNCDVWHINPDKILVAGFSAGGHLAASLGVSWHQEWLAEALQGSKEEWQPNGLMLAYPVISSGEFAHEGSFRALLGEYYDELKAEWSLETQVNAMTPPTFLWHTVEDDAVPVENSLFFASQLRQHHIPFALHVFPKGGHGLSLANAETSRYKEQIVPSVAVWPELYANWVRENI